MDEVQIPLVYQVRRTVFLILPHISYSQAIESFLGRLR